MSVLLTGGCGFIGSHCAIELLKCNVNVILLDNFSNSNKSILKKLKKITGKKIVCYNKNINEKIDFIFKKHNIKCVIHFAAYKAVGESVQDPLKYYDNNISAFISLLKVMRRNNVNKILFSSSATIYGHGNGKPLTENDPPCILNPYGRTKLFGEEILKDVSKAYNIKVICLRYFNPVGCHSSGLIGDNPKAPNNLFPVIASVINGKKESLDIYGDDYNTIDGTGVRDYIHVSDLARGHFAAYNYFNYMANDFEIFNLGTGTGYSVLQIIKEFEQQGVKIPYEIKPRREGDAAQVVADPEKAYLYLGFSTEHPLKDMVRDTLNFIKNNK